MNYSDEELEFFQRLYRETMAMMAETSRASITKNSTFTQHINCYIHSVKELQFYQQAQLREVGITRPALIMDIDLNYCAPDGETNSVLRTGFRRMTRLLVVLLTCTTSANNMIPRSQNYRILYTTPLGSAACYIKRKSLVGAVTPTSLSNTSKKQLIIGE